MVIVIPCYNEARRIQVDDYARVCDLFHTAVFVDDGSSDETYARLSQVKQHIEERGGRAMVQCLPRNVGKGEAVRAGIQCYLATGNMPPALAVADADLSAPFSELARLGRLLKLMGKDIVRSSARHYVGRVSATLISELLDLPIYDTQAGAKVFSARALQSPLFHEPFLSRWLFDCEIFLRARQLGLEVVEEPLDHWRAQPVDSIGA